MEIFFSIFAKHICAKMVVKLFLIKFKCLFRMPRKYLKFENRLLLWYFKKISVTELTMTFSSFKRQNREKIKTDDT